MLQICQLYNENIGHLLYHLLQCSQIHPDRIYLLSHSIPSEKEWNYVFLFVLLKQQIHWVCCIFQYWVYRFFLLFSASLSIFVNQYFILTNFSCPSTLNSTVQMGNFVFWGCHSGVIKWEEDIYKREHARKVSTYSYSTRMEFLPMHNIFLIAVELLLSRIQAFSPHVIIALSICELITFFIW